MRVDACLREFKLVSFTTRDAPSRDSNGPFMIVSSLLYCLLLSVNTRAEDRLVSRHLNGNSRLQRRGAPLKDFYNITFLSVRSVSVRIKIP